MDKTDKIINLYNKLVLYNNELHSMYGNNIFSIDDISFYKPRCIAFIGKHSNVFYYITLRRCNTSHTIMRFINSVSCYNERCYPRMDINEVQDYFKNIVCTPTYKSGVVDEPAILYVGSYDIASTYYCTTSNICINCGLLNISLSNNIFGNVQPESGCSYIFLYDPLVDWFCSTDVPSLDCVSIPSL